MTKSSVLKSKRAYSKRKSKRRKARLTINKERQKDPTLKYKITEKEPLSFVNWCVEKNGASIRVGLMAREKQRGQEIRKCPISYKKTFMLAALDSVDDIGARSL